MKILKFTVLHIALMAYIAFSLNAFRYTMDRTYFSWLPWTITHFFYGMMAPYQGYHITNGDFLVQGRTAEGEWEVINIEPYFPSYLRGEKQVRKTFDSFSWNASHYDEDPYVYMTKRYEEFLRNVKRLEEDRGRMYEELTLHWEDWPMSPAGFFYLRQEPFIERKFLAEIE